MAQAVHLAPAAGTRGALGEQRPPPAVTEHRSQRDRFSRAEPAPNITATARWAPAPAQRRAPQPYKVGIIPTRQTGKPSLKKRKQPVF